MNTWKCYKLSFVAAMDEVDGNSPRKYEDMDDTEKTLLHK